MADAKNDGEAGDNAYSTDDLAALVQGHEERLQIVEGWVAHLLENTGEAVMGEALMEASEGEASADASTADEEDEGANDTPPSAEAPASETSAVESASEPPDTPLADAVEPAMPAAPAAEVPTPVATPVLPPTAPQPTMAPQPRVAAGNVGWTAVLLGAELAADASLARDCQDLIAGLQNGEFAATGLVGQLLVFRAAHAEKMAPMLSHLGEAYYRWRPETAGRPDPFRDRLVDFILQQCEGAGVTNRIELVQPGDRYDSARHNPKPKTQGMEVVDVFGWVVLRENGKAYTKATVSIR